MKVLKYHFTPQEVQALYRFILYSGWIPRDDDEIIATVKRVSEIAEHELVTKPSQTT